MGVRATIAGSIAAAITVAVTAAGAIAVAGCAPSPAAAAAARACDAGLVVLDGACVAPRDLVAYCGGACGDVACDRDGEALDLRRRACVPPLTARTLAARDRAVPGDTRLACRDGSVLVVSDDRVACLPRSATCPRVAPWDAARAACVAPAPCARGSVRDARGACADVIAPGPFIDVGRWARASLGDDGGEGSPRLCSVLAASPWSFDVGSGGARAVPLSIEIVFPDNDVTLVTARVASPDASAAALALADRAVASLLTPLRALGSIAGTTDAASVTTHITCTVRGGAPPLILPDAAAGDADQTGVQAR